MAAFDISQHQTENSLVISGIPDAGNTQFALFDIRSIMCFEVTWVLCMVRGCPVPFVTQYCRYQDREDFFALFNDGLLHAKPSTFGTKYVFKRIDAVLQVWYTSHLYDTHTLTASLVSFVLPCSPNY